MLNVKVKKYAKYDVIVVGGGLAGLSCAFYLCKKGKKVLLLEKRKFLGGRTSSFLEDGMEVESGLHRYIGFYKELPKLLKKCGIRLNDIVTWEETVEILVKDRKGKVVLGIAPFYAPLKTTKGLLGNTEFLSKEDKFSLAIFFLLGLKDYILKKDLDKISIKEYASQCGVTENAQNIILEPFSSGLFFLPMEKYSAYAFFKMFLPSLPRFYKMRVGAFLGGMTDVMCEPIADAITAMDGCIRLNENVESVVINNGEVIGVRTKENHVYYASKTVIATPITIAKDILSELKDREELSGLFNLPSMSVATLQIELTEPANQIDVTCFGSGTHLVSFAEQSRSTFRNKEGRLSIIFGKDEFCNYDKEELITIATHELKDLGIDISGKIKEFRKISEENEFYSLAPSNEILRPLQHTGIKGLVLAGDYTMTSSLCTMEGAVISGKKAAKLCTKK